MGMIMNIVGLENRRIFLASKYHFIYYFAQKVQWNRQVFFISFDPGEL